MQTITTHEQRKRRHEVAHLIGFLGETEITPTPEVKNALRNELPESWRNFGREIHTLCLRDDVPYLRIDRLHSNARDLDPNVDPEHFLLPQGMFELTYRILRGKVAKRFGKEIDQEIAEKRERAELEKLIKKHGLPETWDT